MSFSISPQRWCMQSALQQLVSGLLQVASCARLDSTKPTQPYQGRWPALWYEHLLCISTCIHTILQRCSKIHLANCPVYAWPFVDITQEAYKRLNNTDKAFKHFRVLDILKNNEKWQEHASQLNQRSREQGVAGIAQAPTKNRMTHITQGKVINVATPSPVVPKRIIYTVAYFMYLVFLVYAILTDESLGLWRRYGVPTCHESNVKCATCVNHISGSTCRLKQVWQ